MSHRELNDPSLLDFGMLQVGHGEKESIRSAVSTLKDAQKETPNIPIVMSEINYEGILGKNGAKIQRESFWTSVLQGAAGFTYGANGIWQVNRKTTPFGTSASGNRWGDTPWEEAANFPGGSQVALAMRYLCSRTQLPLYPCTHDPILSLNKIICAKIRNEQYLLYGTDSKALHRVFRLKLSGLPARMPYKIEHFNPVTAETKIIATVVSNNKGTLLLPRCKFKHDWVLFLDPIDTY
jgi:hypothetical protein